MIRQLAILITTLFALTSNHSFSQDQISIYFSSGSHKVSPYSISVLEKKLANLNYDDLLSIQYIGYADSSGNIHANQRLSEKRAKAVSKECSKFLKEEIPFELSFKGETTQKVDSLSRRVDILFHYLEKPEIGDTIAMTANNQRCFGTDEQIHGYIFTKTDPKKKSLIQIELVSSYNLLYKKHYYIKNPNSSNAAAQRVIWKKTKTGKLWWRETRLTTAIPRESFEKFGLVLFVDQPCVGCSEELFKTDTNLVVSTEYKPDYFLESVTQLKTKYLRHNKAEIRVPKEYIDSSIVYRMDLYTGSNEYRSANLNWETKKNKKHQDYLFYDFNIKDIDRVKIQKPQPNWMCPEPYKVGTSNDLPHPWGCGNHSHVDMLYIRTTLSSFYHNDTVTAYAAVKFGYLNNRNQLQGELGLNHRLGFYGAVSYKRYFLDFELMKNRGRNPWQGISQINFSTYVAPYVGLELRTSYNRSYRSFTELNLHTGISVTYNNDFGYYLHGGIARDLSNQINQGFYPYIHGGITYTFRFRLN